jgi:26S proteasome regulatory subunit N7
MGSPKVNQVLPELPSLGDLVKNLYDCHYYKFFVALRMLPIPNPFPTLEQTHLLPSRILSPHARYYVREMRILAYGQLLESYCSLTLESLSGVFGVSVGFVDRCVLSSPHTPNTFPSRILNRFLFVLVLMTVPSELSRFIANGRLHCSIDKVHGIVKTTCPSLKNAQYETVVRQGDTLLNEVQRLSKVLY